MWHVRSRGFVQVFGIAKTGPSPVAHVALPRSVHVRDLMVFYKDRVLLRAASLVRLAACCPFGARWLLQLSDRKLELPTGTVTAGPRRRYGSGVVITRRGWAAG